jgi:hypothetical protein
MRIELPGITGEHHSGPVAHLVDSVSAVAIGII